MIRDKFRMSFTIWTTAAIAIAGWLMHVEVIAQSGSTAASYQISQGWAKLPAGRTLGAPAGVAADPDGKSVWVFERCGGTTCDGSKLAPILKFDASGNLVKSFGAGMFVFPHGLYVDKDGNVWVTDGQGKDGKGHQVFKFSPDGKVLLTLGKAGVGGEGNDTFNMPSAVVTAPNGDIFVADGHNPLPTNMRIVKFSKDGKFIKSWAKKGTGPGELDDPHSIAMDSRGRVFVGDRRNLRIQIFDQNGTVLAEWKNFGRPSGMFISKDDVLYVTNADGIVIASAKDGSILGTIKAEMSPEGTAIAGESLAVDNMGNVFLGQNSVMKLVKYARSRPGVAY